MKRTLLHFTFLFFFVLTPFISAQTYSVMDFDPSPNATSLPGNTNPIEAIWDVQLNYDATTVTGAAGNAGAIYIPSLNKFWTSRWATNIIHQWNADGTLDQQYTLPFTGTRGMVSDGQFIYHSINTTTVQVVNPATRLVVGTIPVVGAPNGARFIAHDPDANGGNGAIIVGNWTSPNFNFYVFSMTGTLLRTITNTQSGVYGLVFDKVSNPGTPYLWVFTQGLGAGTPQNILQMNYTTGLYTGVQHDVKTDVGIGQPATGIAGGLFLTTALVPGKVTLGGIMQGTPDLLFGYELADVIPVELTSFTASTSGLDVNLNWATATEINNQGFEVQKKVGDSFITIGFVEGFGSTTEAREYSFTDSKLSSGVYVYRLKQIDFDGTSDYSQEVEAEVVAPSVFTLDQNYPNPFNPSTKISFSLALDSKVSIKVFNVIGQEVASLVNSNFSVGSHEINFDASHLNSGVYIYRLEASSVDGSVFSSVKKMTLTK